MLTKSQLKDIFSEYGFRPLKRLGENYLIDGNIKSKIIEEVAPSKLDVILEIGPGLGALTMDLASSGAAVYAVEKDKKVHAILKEMASNEFPNLKLFHEDILKFDIARIASEKKLKVVGNLPYYITTPIIEHIIENRKFVESIVMTVQKEVADRLLAQPGENGYSSLSCFIQYYTVPRYVHTIKRNSFYPVPEVDSSLLKLDMLEHPYIKVKNEELLFKIIRGAFNQRRIPS